MITILNQQSVLLLLADKSTFSNVRDGFLKHGYSEDSIKEQYLFEERSGSSFVARKFSDKIGATLSGLDVLVHLFIGQEAIPLGAVDRLLGAQFISDMRKLDLIRLEEDYDLCWASVRLAPVKGLLICSDRVMGGPFEKDHVFDPCSGTSRAFIQLAPTTPCEKLLELCCGSAPCCLAAAQGFAQSACGVDISSRAIHFAEFNRRLNGIENAVMYCGNLFAPVESVVFDRIVAHPPYIPALADTVVFRDGGVDGERVSMEIIRQIPRYLSDRGEFYAYLLLSDRIDSPAELRVRQLLGAEGREFDVALLVQRELRLMEYVSADKVLMRRPSKESDQLIECCRALGITKFLFTGLMVRPKRRRTAITLRQKALSWQTVEAVAGQIIEA